MIPIIKVNGIDIGTPSNLGLGLYDITDGARDSSGKMHIDMIAADKHKFEITYPYLTQEELTNVLRALRGATFIVTAIDPLDGVMKDFVCYKGDRKMPVLDYKDGVQRYKEFTVNFIEC